MRYFFDIQSPALYTPDQEGCQFNSPQEMQAEAVRLLAGVARDEGTASLFVLTVRDESGSAVYRLRAHFEPQDLTAASGL